MRPQYAVQQVRNEVLQRYGFTKEALDFGRLSRLAQTPFGRAVTNVMTFPFRQHPAPNYGTGAWATVKNVAHQSADFARDVAVGSPVDAWRAFKQQSAEHGPLKAYGSLLKNYYWAPHAEGAGTLSKGFGTVGRLLGLGTTGMDLYNAVTGDPDHRAGDLTAAGVGALISPITGTMGWKLGPLAHAAITNSARNLGHRLDSPTHPPAPLTPIPPSVGPHLRRALRAHNMLSGANPNDLGSLFEDG